MSDGLPLIRNVLIALAKSLLLPLALPAGSLATDPSIQKNFLGLETAALIISNEEMEDIMRIVKSLEKSGLLMEGISETIKNEAKAQKYRFLRSY